VRVFVQTGRGKLNAMPRRQATPASRPQHNLKSIPGALALYRVGDVIYFDLNGVEFDAPVESVEVEEGKAVLWVTTTVGIHASHVRRVERRGRQ
jgi:hypothetical protein